MTAAWDADDGGVRWHLELDRAWAQDAHAGRELAMATTLEL